MSLTSAPKKRFTRYSSDWRLSGNALFTLLLFGTLLCIGTQAFVAFPRGGSFGYLAAVAVPLDLPNRNVYVSFNFESNYGFPPNDSIYTWIDRWNLDNSYLGIGSNVTAINGRSQTSGHEPNATSAEQQRHAQPTQTSRYTRHAFYRTLIGLLDHYAYNGTACLWRTVCEVAAARLHVANGLLGSIFHILFIPTSSAAEAEVHADFGHAAYEASERGRAQANGNGCAVYAAACPDGLLDLISTFY